MVAQTAQQPSPDGPAFEIREATPDDDKQIAAWFKDMWCDIGHTGIEPDWEDRVLSFLKDARTNLQGRGYIAYMDGQPVGSAACQLFAGMYPLILQAHERKYGYIWAVFVVKEHRRKGIAKALTAACASYLKSIGCNRAVLHASPAGRPVYEQLGFTASNEMRLDLI